MFGQTRTHTTLCPQHITTAVFYRYPSVLHMPTKGAHEAHRRVQTISWDTNSPTVLKRAAGPSTAIILSRTREIQITLLAIFGQTMTSFIRKGR